MLEDGIEVPLLAQQVDQVCTREQDQPQVLLHLARISYGCRCLEMEEVERRAQKLLHYSDEKENQKLAEASQRLGRCFYYRVLRKDYGTARDKSKLLHKALTWSQSAVIRLDKVPQHSRVTILITLKALVDAANSLKLQQRYRHMQLW